jgi:hypothetical protein
VRKAEVFFRSGCLASLVCLALAGICACGSKESSASGTSVAASKSHKASKPRPSKPGDVALGDMVAAVGSSKAGPPVEMKFLLLTRPEVGQVVDVEVALIPRAPIPDDFAASFSAVEGLEIVDGGQLERVDKLVNGLPIRHVIKIRPTRDGIFALLAVVSIDQANQNLVRTFSIPVIAGEGLPEQVAKGP